MFSTQKYTFLSKKVAKKKNNTYFCSKEEANAFFLWKIDY